MTLQELSYYFNLREQLMRDEAILESLRATACPGAQVLTGMPHVPGVRDKVGDLAVEIADMEGQIKLLRDTIEREEVRVSEFISTIESDQVRIIFRLRFLRCLTWKEVAGVIGGRNTENAVKSLCYRYLESCNAVTHRDA